MLLLKSTFIDTKNELKSASCDGLDGRTTNISKEGIKGFTPKVQETDCPPMR